jgi:hypothetical protein
VRDTKPAEREDETSYVFAKGVRGLALLGDLKNQIVVTSNRM